jgi:maleylacetoacetate isomerase
MADIVLYNYWRSSSSYRVRFALAYKGLAYRYVAVNLIEKEQRDTTHVQRSPTGYVPCLEIDGRTVAESVAIIELIDELFPEPPLMPRDPWHRARVRALVEIVNAGVQPLQNLTVLERHSGDQKERTAWAKHFNERGLDALERTMAANEALGIKGKYAYGDSITTADLFIVPQLYSARRFGVEVGKFPRVLAAGDAAALTKAGQAALPEAQPDAMKQ